MALKSYSLLRQRLRIRQLRVAVAVAEQGSIVRASKALGLTQPAATRNLLELEDYLGVRLFDRLPRGVALTRTGELVLARARRILAEVDRIPDDLSLVESGLSETAVIGVLPSAATGLLPRVLSLFAVEHPQIAIQVVEGRTNELLALLAAGKLDLILGRLYEAEGEGGFHRRALYHEPLAILAREGHPLFVSGGADPRRLSAHRMVLPTVTQRIGQDVDRAIRDNAITVRAPALRVSSMSLIRELILTTDHLAVLSRLTLVGDLIRGDIRVVPCEIRTPPRPGGVILRAGAQAAPSMQALLAVIESCVAELVVTGYLGALKS